MEFIVETSARHAHISKEHLKVLFGEDAELVVKKMLSQPGQYASEQKIQVVGPRGSLMMSILGPTRKDTQIEVSLSVVCQNSTYVISSSVPKISTLILTNV